MENKELYKEVELGKIALNLLTYKFKIYSATSQLILGLTSLLIVFSIITISKTLKNIYAPKWIWFSLFLLFFVIFFSLAIAVENIFRKSLKSLRHLISIGGNKIDEKRINYIYVFAFSLPYITLYMFNPLPLWYSFA